MSRVLTQKLARDRCIVAGQVVAVETSSDEIRQTLRYMLQGFGMTDSDSADAAPYGLHLAGGVWSLTSPGAPLHETTDPLQAYSLFEQRVIRDALARRDDLFQLHGAALCHPLARAGLVVAGGSHHGKTTLALGLCLRAFLPFSDDTILIDPATLHLQPFPRAFHVSDHTWTIVTEQHHGLLTRPRSNPREYFSPPQWAVQLAPVRWMIFTEIGHRPAPTAQRLAPADAAAAMLRHTSSLDATPQMALATVSRLTAQAACYRVVAGDPGATVALVMKITAGQL